MSDDNEDAMSKAVGEKLYGPIGRGASPVMRNISPYELSRYAGKALRNEGIKDDRHLKNTKAWDPRSEQQKDDADDRRFDEAMSNMYNEMRKPVKSAARPMSKAKIPLKKGGTRKRSTRRRGSRRSKRSRSRKSRRNKRSRK